jgi:preprotein translocase subunit SecF
MVKNKKKQKDLEENKFLSLYKKKYKQLIIIPIILLFLSLFFIYDTINKEGLPIYRDISLKGGLSANLDIQSDILGEEFERALNENFPSNSFSVSETSQDGIKQGYIVDTDLEEEKFMIFINDYFSTEFVFDVNYSSNFISESLSSSFFKQSLLILLISFFLMSSVIFLYFRKLLPSGAIILSAIYDLIVTIAILNMIEFKISIAGIGALLMLIGYSIDTDVLLTNRLIKEFGGDIFEKTYDAFKTGLLMSFTTLSAGIITLILSNSSVIQEIALILVIGLIVDFISTWFQNATILLYHLEKNNNK